MDISTQAVNSHYENDGFGQADCELVDIIRAPEFLDDEITKGLRKGSGLDSPNPTRSEEDVKIVDFFSHLRNWASIN